MLSVDDRRRRAAAADDAHPGRVDDREFPGVQLVGPGRHEHRVVGRVCVGRVDRVAQRAVAGFASARPRVVRVGHLERRRRRAGGSGERGAREQAEQARAAGRQPGWAIVEAPALHRTNLADLRAPVNRAERAWPVAPPNRCGGAARHLAFQDRRSPRRPSVEGQGLPQGVGFVSWSLSRAASGSTTGSRPGYTPRFWLYEAVLRGLWWCRARGEGPSGRARLRFAHIHAQIVTNGLRLSNGDGNTPTVPPRWPTRAYGGGPGQNNNNKQQRQGKPACAGIPWRSPGRFSLR